MAEQLQTKKIAKNTILLYFRMILGMVVSLYTSRVVLRVLGIDDFGIYNIIGGVIVMFSFINTFLTSACQRYISVSIAKDSIEETKKIFSTSLFIHILVSLLFAIFAETFGLYFVYKSLVIPEARFAAALCVFHIMVVESCISIFKVPYNAAIIAEEKMDFYAYTSIAENILRLVVIYLLVIIPFDKLIIYAFLHILISFVMLLWYKIFVDKRLSYSTNSLRYDKKYLKSMVSFSGWNLFGSIADLGYKQGTNIVLNLFYGVTLNAAMGIATTVRSSIYSFISNIQVAANPQIIKSYAIGQYEYYSTLICRISKYSYFLMLFLSIPIIINIKYILLLWLGEAPKYTESLIVLGMIFCLIDCLHGPLWTSMQASGRIRNYQLLVSIVLLLNIPFSYIALKMGYSPNSILVVQIVVSIITLVVRLLFSSKYAELHIAFYLKNVMLPVVVVTILSVPIPLYMATFFDNDLKQLFITSLASAIMITVVVLAVGVTKSERYSIFNIILKRIKNGNKNPKNIMDR